MKTYVFYNIPGENNQFIDQPALFTGYKGKVDVGYSGVDELYYGYQGPTYEFEVTQTKKYLKVGCALNGASLDFGAMSVTLIY